MREESEHKNGTHQPVYTPVAQQRPQSLRQLTSVADDEDSLNGPAPITLADSAELQAPPPAPSLYSGNASLAGKRVRRRFVLSAALVAAVLLVGGGLLFAHLSHKDKQPDQLSSKKTITTISPQDLLRVTSQDSAQTANQVTVNGPLQINSRLVVNPSEKPKTAQAGQIYFDSTTRQFTYFDGVNYQVLATNSLLNDLSQLSKASTGDGLVLNNNSLVNSGVLTIQGAAGNVNFSAGTGIALNGTQITNTGVTALSGTPDQISVSAASGGVTLSLPQNIGPSSSPTFAGLNLSSPLGVASGGTGSTSYGTNGVVYFDGVSLKNVPLAPSSGLCLLSTGGAPAFGSCSGGSAVTSLNSLSGTINLLAGAGITITPVGNDLQVAASAAAGVTSLNGLTGALTVADASVAGSTITINTATAAVKGIASFGSDFSVTGGAVSLNAVSVAKGGTGRTSFGTNTVLLGNGGSGIAELPVGSNGQCLLIVSGAPTFGTCTGAGGVSSLNSKTGGVTVQGGTGIVVDNTGANIVINNGGVTQVQGTTNQVAVSGSTGSVTFSLPQDIATTSNVVFNQATLGLNGTAAGKLVLRGGTSNSVVLQAPASPTGGLTFTLPTTAGTASDCLRTDGAGVLSFSSCVGGGSGGGISGTGTTNQLAKFSAGQVLANANIADDGTTVTISSGAVVQGAAGLTIGTSSTAGVLDLSDGSSNQTRLQSAAIGSNLTFTLPGTAGTASQCIKTNGAGVLSFGDCLTGGSGSGVNSIIGTAGGSLQASGDLTINNAATTGSTITINDATTSAKGIASFNPANFSLSSGAVSIANDGVALATQTTGNYIASLLAGNGLTGDTSGEGATASLAIGAGDGIIANADSLTLNLQANKGLEVDGNGLSLIDCASGEILKYNGSNQWACATDATGVVGANTTLSNLTSPTAINQNLLADTTNTRDLGSNAVRFKDLYLQGNAAIAGTINSAAISGGTISGGTLTASAVNGLDVSATAITPSGALTIGATGQTLTLQGSAASTITASGGGGVTTIGFAGTPTGNVVYNFDRAATAGTYTVCATSGNCIGSPGGGITSAGTSGRLAKFGTGAYDLINSLLSEPAANTLQLNSATAVLQSTGTLSLAAAAGNNSLTLTKTGTGNLVFTGFNCIGNANNGKLTADASGNISCADDTGAGPAATLQTAYTNSTNPEITLDATRGALTIRDNATPLGGNLLEIQSNGGTNYLQVSATQTTVGGNFAAQGTAAITGALTLGTPNNTSIGQLILADGTNDGFGLTLQSLPLGHNMTLNVPYSTGTSLDYTDVVCLAILSNCSGPNGGAGNTNYVFNQTSQQLNGNFNIKARTGTIGGVIQGAASQDIVRLVDSGGVVRAKINSSGDLTAVGGTFTGGVDVTGQLSSTSLSIAGGALSVDNSGNLSTSGTAAVQGSGGLTLGVAGSGGIIGNLNLANATSTRLVVIQGLNPTGTGNATVQVPSLAGGSTDTFCLAAASNCAATGSAGGDLTGTYPNPTVAKLQGKTLTITAGTPTTGAVLQYNGTAFVDGLLANTNLQSGSYSNITGAGSAAGAASFALQAGTGGLSITTQGTGALNIGNNAVAQTLNIGNTTGATALNERVGTGNYSLDGVASSTYTFGASTTTGSFTLGGTAQTGNIDLGIGTGAQAINLGTGGTGAKTVTAGSTASTSSTTIQGGTGGINVGTGGIANTIQIGNITGAVAQTINIGNNATASSTSTVVIGSTIAGNVTLQSAGTINIAQNSAAQTVNIGNTTGATAILERVGTGNYSLDGVAASSYTLGASTVAGTITIGGTAQTGTLSVGQSTASYSLNLGNATIATGNTGTIAIGTSATGTGKTAITIGSTNGASSLILQSGSGGIKLGANGALAVPYVDSSNVIQFANASATNSYTKCLLSDGTTNIGFGTCPSGSAGWNLTGSSAAGSILGSNANTTANFVISSRPNNVGETSSSASYISFSGNGSSNPNRVVIAGNPNGNSPQGGGSYSSANTKDYFRIQDSSGNVAFAVQGNSAGTQQVFLYLSAGSSVGVSSRVCSGLSTGGSGMATLATCTSAGTDLAEAYNSTQALEPGDIVANDPNQYPNVLRSDHSQQDNLVGVISTEPDDTLGKSKAPNGYPLALVGRVPTKVNAEGGPIHAGDKITSSSVSGVGKKASGPGMVVGTALQDYDGSSQSVIEVFVHIGYYDPTSAQALQGDQIGNFTDINASGMATVHDLAVTGSATIHELIVTGNATVQGTLTAAVINTGDINLSGHIVSSGTTPAVSTPDDTTSATVQIDGTDVAGTITVDVTTAMNAGDLADVVFAHAFAAAPRVTITPDNATAALIHYFTQSRTATGFSLSSADSVAPGTYRFNYQVIQ